VYIKKRNSSKHIQLILWVYYFKGLREKLRRITFQLHCKIQYISLSDFILIFYLNQFCKIPDVHNLQ